MKKSISIFGVTGSVGNSTIELLRKRKDEFEVIAITCNSDIKNISLLANEFNPKIVAVANEKKLKELKESILVILNVVLVPKVFVRLLAINLILLSLRL